MNQDHWLQDQISHIIWHRIRVAVDSMNWVETPWVEEPEMPQLPIMTARTKYGGSGEGEQALYTAKSWTKIEASLLKFLYYPEATDNTYRRDWELAVFEVENRPGFHFSKDFLPGDYQLDEDVCSSCKNYKEDIIPYIDPSRKDWCSDCLSRVSGPGRKLDTDEHGLAFRNLARERAL